MKKFLFTAGLLMLAPGLLMAQFTATSPTTTFSKVGIGTNTPAYPLTVSSYVASGFGYLSAMYTNNYMPLSEYGFGLENLGYGGHSWRFLSAAQGSTVGVGNFAIADATVGATRLVIGPTGNIGIGLIVPRSKLHVSGTGNSLDAITALSDQGMTIEAGTGNRSSTVGAQLEFAIPANTDGTNLFGQGRIITVAGNASNANATGKMILGTRRWLDKTGTGGNWYYGDDLMIDGNGRIGINTPDTKGYQLAVNGGVVATAVTVKVYPFADYVFDKEYRLAPLSEVKAFIDKNHHLPEMPAAAEVESKGLNLGEINVLLTQKVEELTLYLIEQNKRIARLEKLVSKTTEVH